MTTKNTRYAIFDSKSNLYFNGFKWQKYNKDCVLSFYHEGLAYEYLILNRSFLGIDANVIKIGGKSNE